MMAVTSWQLAVGKVLHASRFLLRLAPIAYCLLPTAYLLFSSCGNPDADSTAGEESSSRTNGNKGDMKVFLLPAPLQVASVLKLEDYKYSEKILERTKQATADYHVEYLKALNLGICSIDMGYTAVYSDHSNMMKYASRIQGLMGDLNIRSSVKSNTVERVKNNVGNKDSLYLIILESYREAHDYFKSNEREDVGLMILAGSFVEGLYIATSIAKDRQGKELMSLIAQHKTFLQNISSLLKKYPEQKDIKKVIAKMDELEKAFEGIETSYNSTTDKLENVSISTHQLQALCEKAGEIRNEIIN